MTANFVEGILRQLSSETFWELHFRLLVWTAVFWRIIAGAEET